RLASIFLFSISSPYLFNIIKVTNNLIEERKILELNEYFLQLNPVDIANDMVDLRDKETGVIGIGLAIVKSIVDTHGGQIFVQSELNKGTEFIIKSPN
ncbi:MAG: ATP-binding protein, partial [Terrisporobacter sp.]